MTMAPLAETLLSVPAADLPEQQNVRYTYWPVNYFLGDPSVISSAGLPLSGVKFSRMAKGVGELQASLQVSDPDVRAMKPWELVVPRKTGIVVIRSTMLSTDTEEVHTIEWHGTVWSAPVNDQTGRMEITARSVEYGWAQRLITGPPDGGDLVFAQTDVTFIARELLRPWRFSQLGPQQNFGTGVATVSAGTPDRIVMSSVNAASFPTGTYIVILRPNLTYHYAADDVTKVFRVTGQSSAGGGNTNVIFTPNADGAIAAGETAAAIALFPGWITVDPPTKPTGVLQDLTYKRNQQTNLLQAHQDRSNTEHGYDWYTTTRVLEGTNPFQASSYRVQFVMGYPRLGREYGEDEIPRFSKYIDGRGNVISADTVYDGSSVRNVVWGQGAGYDTDALRALSFNSADWDNGFLMTEGKYSNPDVSVASTLQSYTDATLIQSYANERFLKAVTVRGDLPPYFGTYNICDDALYTSDGWGNPDAPSGSRELTYITRIMGWTVTPPEGTNSETIDLLLAGGSEGGDFG